MEADILAQSVDRVVGSCLASESVHVVKPTMRASRKTSHLKGLACKVARDISMLVGRPHEEVYRAAMEWSGARHSCACPHYCRVPDNLCVEC